jgi:hypothetical protein
MLAIVEGHGDEAAVPVLLRRMVAAIDPTKFVDILQPFRVPRTKLVRPNELERYLDLAASTVGTGGCVLVVIDADDDCAADLGPTLLSRAGTHRPDLAIGVALAVREFEAWFLAAATSLRGKRGMPPDLVPPAAPETIRDAKGWLQQRKTDGRAYAETIDQPALAATMDVLAARAGSPSFDKLWREVERLVVADHT